MLFRADLSGRRGLSGRRASVASCPLEWAVPTAAYDARDDSPPAEGGRSRCPDFSASRARDASRRGGASRGPVPGCPCRASRAVYPPPSRPPGRSGGALPRASTPLCLLATAGDAGGPGQPRLGTDGLGLPAVCVQTLGVRTQRLGAAVPALQGARSPLRPPGDAVDASPLLFAVSPRLRHGRKTRDGGMAHPYPTGTFTPQETPSFLGATTPGVRRPESGRGADAVGRRLHCLYRYTVLLSVILYTPGR